MPPDVSHPFEGQRFDAGGDKPIPLDDPDSVWLILSGKVDVFSTQPAPGQLMGPRRHLLRLEAKEAFFGTDALQRSDEDLHLLAVGVAGTVLLKLGRKQFVEAARGEDATLVASLLDGWVEGLSAVAVGEATQPEGIEAPEPGGTVDLKPGEVLRAERGADLWVRHLSGTSRFLGDPDLPAISPRSGFFPLSGVEWLEAAGDTRLEVLDTLGYLARDDGSLEGLDAFHAAVLSVFAAAWRRAAGERRERLRRSVEADGRLARGAVRRLGEVTRPRPDETPVQAGVPDDALLAACGAVGRVLGVEFRRPVGTLGRVADPVEEVSRASRVRCRRVLLRDDWWRGDGGPLLAFRGEDERPVALIPKGPSAYDLLDPAAATREAVDRGVASELREHAYTFYVPFPDRAVGLRDLLRYSLRGLRRDIVTVAIMGTLGGLLGALVPIASKEIVDTAIPQADVGFVLVISVGLAIGAVCAMLFAVVSAFAVQRIETRMDASVQSAVWDRLLGLPAPFFREYTSGDLATRAMGINTIRQLVTGATIASLLSGVFSVFSFGVVFYYSATLGLIAMLMVAFIAVVTAVGGYVQLRYARRTAVLQGEISSLVLQLLSGVAKLRVAGAERRAFAVWADRYALQRHNSVKSQAAANALLVFGSVSGILTSIVVFAFVAFAAAGSLDTGEFVAFNAAFAQFLVSSAGITTAFTTIVQAAPFYERAKPILEALPEVESEKPHPGELAGRVEVSHASLRYDPEGPLVLDDVSIRAEPGEFVAIVGPSGAGKSSLFRLLLGFEEPESGSVYYDDHELPGVDVQAVRRQMGVVLQNGRLMPGTIFHNIVGSSALTMEDAWEAARLAGLGADIEAMPMGMFTILGEGSATISGGQRQRLMIARAIAKRPRILLFDEATSALDNRTQAVISASLEKLRATRIVIAHRLSTIINADRIYVLRAGKVAQSGTYRDLIGREGPFRDLASRQIV